MTTAKPQRRRLTRPGKPLEARPFVFAAVWLALAMGATAGAFVVAASTGLEPLLRLIFVLAIVMLALWALMLASERVAQGVTKSFPRWTRSVYWLTTSVAVLAVVILGGAAVTLLVPDEPGLGHVAIDILVDLGLGSVAGAFTVGAIMLAGWGFDKAMHGFMRVFHSRRQAGGKPASTGTRPAERQPAETQPAEAPHPGSWPRQLLRGALIGAAGLLLSAAYTAIVTTATTNHNGAAEVPTHVLKSGWSTILGPLLAWFLGTGVAWTLFSRGHVRRGSEHLIAAHPRLRHATHGAALAVCLLVVGGWITATALEHRAERRLWSGKPYAAPTVRVTSAQWMSSSPYLAQRFEPRLWLTREERWSPTSVGWYLANSDTTTTAPYCQTREGCHQLNVPKLSCDGARPPKGCAPSGAADPGLYYRYCEGDECGPETPRTLGRLWKVIQYWIFYNYDSLDAGAITQWHQADWEQISVLAQRTNDLVRPVEVAFSEHCYGALLPAERVRWQGTHPVSYVGNGSHANYPRPVSLPVREVRCRLGLTPRYFGVAGLFFEPGFDGTSIELPLDYLIGLRDRAEQARAVGPLPLLPLTATPAVTAFRGAWGRDNNLSFLDAGPQVTGAGPPAPEVQAPWEKPFPAMFCSHGWLSMALRQRPTTSWVCPPV